MRKRARSVEMGRRDRMTRTRTKRPGAALLAVAGVAVLAATLIATGAGAEVYQKGTAEFSTQGGGKAKGYEVRARSTYAYPLKEVLDASHDHAHMAEKDEDIEREEADVRVCTKYICRINVDVIVGSFFPVGEVKYELDTEIEAKEGGAFFIKWDKTKGSRFIKFLHGELRLTPVGEEGNHTRVDYHLQVAAPRLSPDKLAAKAEAYLERLGVMLAERHDGHSSVWERMKGGM
jgi:hypothetical protein